MWEEITMVIDWASFGPLLAYIATIIAIVGAVYKIFGTLSNRITTLEADSRLFWTVLQPRLAEIIHSPTHPRRDLLVDRFNESDLSVGELIELAGLLDLNIRENCDTAKRLASALLLGRVEAALDKRHAPDWRSGKGSK
jgi:hypothetical protein